MDDLGKPRINQGCESILGKIQLKRNHDKFALTKDPLFIRMILVTTYGSNIFSIPLFGSILEDITRASSSKLLTRDASICLSEEESIQ